MTTPIQIGIAGLGRAGWGMHCRELDKRKDKFTIVAACDVDEDRLRQMRERYPDIRTYGSLDDMLGDTEVELVDIATRSCDHFQQAARALTAGKDVFLEKPMCVTYEEAVALKGVADFSRGNLYIRHNRRFEPAFQHIREIIASGILGEVYEIKLRRTGYQRRADWQTLKKYGGGQLLNWGPHIIDHALCFLGHRVKRVQGYLRKAAAAGDMEDHLKIIFTGCDQLLVDMEISGAAAIAEPEYLVWGTRGGLVCHEQEGRIRLKHLDPNQKLPKIRAQSATPKSIGFDNPEKLVWVEKDLPVKPAKPVKMDMIWDALYEAVRNGLPFPVTLEESVAVMKVVSEVRRGDNPIIT